MSSKESHAHVSQNEEEPDGQTVDQPDEEIPSWSRWTVPDIPPPDDQSLIDSIDQQFNINVLFQKMRSTP